MPSNHLPPVRMPIMPSPPEVRVFKNEKQISPPPPPPLRTMNPPSPPSRWWCFFGVHKYQVKDESTWKKDNGRTTAKGPMYVLRCDVCGKMKAVCL